MPVQQLRCPVDHLWAHRRLGQIGDPKNQRPPRLQPSQDGRGAQVIRFGRLRLQLRQRLQKLAHVRRTAPRQQLLLDAPSVAQQPDAVAGKERELGQRHGRRRGVVELGEAILRFVRIPGGHARPHQPSRIQDDPDGLAPLRLVLPRYQVAAPRRGSPAHIAQVVAGAVFAQTLKLAAQASLAHLAQLQLDAPALGQK